MDKKYAVIMRTGEAELRAFEMSQPKVLDKILPIIEITRGRKKTIKDEDGKPLYETYPFNNRIQKIKKLFENKVITIDLTSEKNLSCPEVDELYDPFNGYENWINFLVGLKKEKVFKDIIPTIIINVTDPDFDKNFITQIKELGRYFSKILYRNSIEDEGCYSDLELIHTHMQGYQEQLIIAIDCGYVQQASHDSYSNKVIARIKNIQSIIGPRLPIIVTSTSFPNNVKDLGDVDNDVFNLAEVTIFDTVSIEIPNIIYGDYAAVNPIRNDGIVMARGWIPRIDVPLEREIYYYKQRRPGKSSAYSNTYSKVAMSVVKDKRFPVELKKNKGIYYIQKASEGAVPSSAPSFWISVRICIHLEQQCRRLHL
jgi:hypothetical protein